MRVLATMNRALRLCDDLQFDTVEPLPEHVRTVVLQAANQSGLTVGQFLLLAATEKATALLSAPASHNDNTSRQDGRVFLRDDEQSVA